ncbi:hypothetical protein CHARACLAT_027299 [Characodon lateralis]|uniref:Uncharacterized protein n=1 Tax=Characodon lateralis TaxID=208331 RepID=A0ABU7EQX9_9TELE|nr:hypothetical protein [Characodon lateralis]
MRKMEQHCAAVQGNDRVTLQQLLKTDSLQLSDIQQDRNPSSLDHARSLRHLFRMATQKAAARARKGEERMEEMKYWGQELLPGCRTLLISL